MSGTELLKARRGAPRKPTPLHDLGVLALQNQHTKKDLRSTQGQAGLGGGLEALQLD